MLTAALNRITSLALPPRCPGCSAIVEADHRFCVECWAALRFIGPPWCAGCRLPFAFERGEALCATCLGDPPEHAGVFAPVTYGAVSRTVALRLKYGGRAGNAATMARLMARTLPAETAMLVPVPLHWRRLWGRGFNQAALIAHAIGRDRRLPVVDCLRRTRATPPLKGMGAKARARAVRGAFALAENADAIRGRAVALVDDVYTSGATTDACVRALSRGGATSVAVVAWARVIDREAAD